MTNHRNRGDSWKPGKVSTRLYQTPGKENRPMTIIAQKPQTRSGSKSLVVTETKIVAKLRNKDNKFKDKFLNTQTKNDRMREYSETQQGPFKLKNFEKVTGPKYHSKGSNGEAGSKILSTHNTSKQSFNKHGSDYRSNHFLTEDGRMVHTIELDEEVAETLASHRA